MRLSPLAALAALVLLASPDTSLAQSVAIGEIESFDSLASNGTSSSLPAGWFISESDANANTSYTADNGALNAGDTYSYGSTGSTERALGSLQSGSLLPMFGARVVNDTGSTLSQLDVAYTGEQWRLGATGREDRLDFQFSTDATSLASGTWTAADALDFVAPVTTGSTGALDGNASANRVAIAGTLTGLELAAGASLWVRWVDGNAASSDDGLAIDDLTFGQAVDNPPQLVASTPAEGGALAANAALSLTFSEPVSVAGEWFAIDCGASGALAVADTTVSGGPTSWQIDPDADLSVGAQCTLRLAAAAVLDQDGSADALTGTLEVAFTVTSPPANIAPSVLSTTPAQGSSSFPSAADLGVTFSEAVSIAGGAFTLTCASSTGIALSYPASGTSIAIGTGTALAFGDSCTFGIDASRITDADGAALIAIDPVRFTVAADSAAGYYDQVNDSSAEQLRCSLNATISGHTAYPYTAATTDTWDILNLADEDPLDSSKVWDVYRNASYTKISGGQGEYNREHTWPNTYGFSSADPGAYTDTHMLYVTHVQYNSDRGSKPYADCDSGCGERATVANHGVGGTGGGTSNWVQSGASENLGSFEVWDFRKGDMARAVMYMAIRYEGAGMEPDLELTDNRSLITSAGSGGRHYMGLLTALVAWHQADPPDERERQRNEVVYGFQGNRNPFIDHPEWGTLALFTSAQPATCTPALPAAIFRNGFEAQ